MLIARSETLIGAFEAAAVESPSARLLVASDTRPSVSTLAELVEAGRIAGANLQRLGITPGDVVAVQLPAWREWLIACVAAAHAGATLLPIVTIYGAAELSFVLRQSGAKMLVTPDYWRRIDFTALLADCGELPDLSMHVVVGHNGPGELGWDEFERPAFPSSPAGRRPDDLALLVYTSGTTAAPKGVMHSNRTLLAEAELLARHRLSLSSEPVVLSPWPLGHIAGVCTMLGLLVSGISVVSMDQWDAASAAALTERYRATCCSGTPFHLAGLLDAADAGANDISSLTDFMVGAAPVPPVLIERCAARGLATYRCYGSSEHPTVTMGHPGDPVAKRLATEGRAMAGTELRVVDDEGLEVAPGSEGEIATRGPELFLGYFDATLDQAAFLPGGWFRTGDIGRLDEDGYLLITDRKKDIIIRGGENIASREVEDVLHHHPAIAEVAVVAAPDSRMGEVVCAFAVLRPDMTLTLDDVRGFFAEAGLARQKTPERLVLIDALPRNATGKVLKQELRASARSMALASEEVR